MLDPVPFIHLLVPGGKWQTEISSPVSSASSSIRKCSAQASFRG
jgi:hypothetical protein